jgi:plastocyanin
LLNRRLTVALAATAAAGISAAGMAGTAAAAKKNQIVIRGKLEWRAGKGVSDNQRFLPLNAKVKSGATIKVVNKAKTEDPHTLSFVRKAFMPATGEFSPASAGPLFGLHALESPAPVLKIDNGAPAADQAAPLAVDTAGTPDAPGDSELMAPGQKRTSFTVTAAAGSKLNYYCIFHPWMQGKISVR